MYRKLSLFENSEQNSLETKIKAQVWLIVQLLSNLSQSSTFRIFAIRLFGGKIGAGVIIKSRVRVHFPWNLEIGDDCWVGEEVWFINHEKISIGSNVCISQRSIICSGSHNYRSASLEYNHKCITIKQGAWICFDAKILPGVTIGECSVVSAGEVVRKSLPDFSMLVGGEIRPIQPPK